MLDPSVSVSKDNVYIDNSAILEHSVCVGSNVRIGKNARILRNTIIKDNVEIGDGAIIEENCIIGYDNLTRIWDKNFVKTVKIGKNALIRSGSIVYIGCSIGENSKINHGVVMRENTSVGSNTSLGCLIKCEGYTTIGDNCSIHAQTHLTSFMVIEDYVFMGPHCTTANDPRIDYERNLNTPAKGPTIKFGARIASHVMICPGVVIGREAFVGAGSVVLKDVGDFSRVFGVPARSIGQVDEEERLKL